MAMKNMLQGMKEGLVTPSSKWSPESLDAFNEQAAVTSLVNIGQHCTPVLSPAEVHPIYKIRFGRQLHSHTHQHMLHSVCVGQTIGNAIEPTKVSWKQVVDILMEQ